MGKNARMGKDARRRKKKKADAVRRQSHTPPAPEEDGGVLPPKVWIDRRSSEDWQAAVFAGLGPCEECGAAFEPEPAWGEEGESDMAWTEDTCFVCTGPEEHPRVVTRVVWHYATYDLEQVMKVLADHQDT